MIHINWQYFEEYILEKMEQENIAGIAVAVSKNGETIYQKGFGYRNIETKEPVTPETIFGIASITKSFTAYVIMMLEEQGFLSVNDPINQYIHEFKIKGLMEDVKIHHLLSHTTGLAPLVRKEELNILSDHIQHIENNHQLLGKPGEYFSYCNDTFLLLGLIIERLTGQSFKTYITEHILNKLKMNRSTISLEEVKQMDNVSVPYDHNKENKLNIKPWPKLGNYEVGGGIRSTVLDLMKYGSLYVNKSNLVSKKMWMNPYKIQNQNYYGYAFKVTPDYNGLTLVEHGGSQTGVSSHFGFVPEEDLVVAILCNVSGIKVDDIWLKAVNTALNLPFEQKRMRFIKETLNKPLENYCGTYRSLEGATITIIIEGNDLYLTNQDRKFKLIGYNNHTFVIKEKDRPIYFYFKGDQSAWAVLYGSRMLTRDILHHCT